MISFIIGDNMQRGIATFEVILAALIIAFLASVAVPNVTRVVDRVALDYETKRLYTDLRALQAFDRMTNMRDSHFKIAVPDDSVRLIVYPERYDLEKNSNSTIYATHYFSNGVTADKAKIIKFDDMGKVSPADSDHLTFKSRLGKEVYFYFNSIGRFRPSTIKNDEP